MTSSVFPMSKMTPTDCTADSLQHPSSSNFAISVCLFLGIVLSYVPQHHRIITRKSSEGISPLFVLLGVTSATCTMANIWMLGWGVVGCCATDLGPYQCFAGMLGIWQVTGQWAAFMVILLLFLLYFPSATPVLPTEDDLSTDSHKHRHAGVRTALSISIISIIHLIVTFAVSVYLYTTASVNTILWWTSIQGVLATILASIQYFPQIWTTYKLKAAGSLSIPMMCIQTPGGFLWAISLALRPGTAWSSWMVYCVAASLQGILLVMAIVYERRRKSEESDAALFVEPDAENYEDEFVHEADHVVRRERRPANERTRLLADEDESDL